MNLLEIFLLILVTYGLLAAGRKQKKKQPTRAPALSDPALEEALREIREALRWPEPETKRETWASKDEEFRSLERMHTPASQTPPFHSPEASPLETLFDRGQEADEVFSPEPKQARARVQTHWLGRLRQREGVREAIVLAELLGPPRARRPWRPRFGLDHLG